MKVVCLEKFLWTVLSVLLLKLAMEHQTSNMEDYLAAIILNLCIGLSMLFIPLATRSLINDGLEMAASGLALAPATAAVSAAKIYAKQAARQGVAKTWGCKSTCHSTSTKSGGQRGNKVS